MVGTRAFVTHLSATSAPTFGGDVIVTARPSAGDLALFELDDMPPAPPSTGSIPRDYSVRPIPMRLAHRLAIERHYLHRAGPWSKAFGMFGANGMLYGFITYGTPSSAPLRSAIAGPEHSLNVVELTRLWIDDRVAKNGASYLIGQTIRECGKEIVVSFAEPEQGHVGTVYQATNWLYTGLSTRRTNWSVVGEDHRHGQTWGDTYTADELRANFGERFVSLPRPRKHRYVYLNAKGARRRQLRAALRYPVQPYPSSSGVTP